MGGKKKKGGSQGGGDDEQRQQGGRGRGNRGAGQHPAASPAPQGRGQGQPGDQEQGGRRGRGRGRGRAAALLDLETQFPTLGITQQGQSPSQEAHRPSQLAPQQTPHPQASQQMPHPQAVPQQTSYPQAAQQMPHPQAVPQQTPYPQAAQQMPHPLAYQQMPHPQAVPQQTPYPQAAQQMPHPLAYQQMPHPQAVPQQTPYPQAAQQMPHPQAAQQMPHPQAFQQMPRPQAFQQMPRPQAVPQQTPHPQAAQQMPRPQAVPQQTPHHPQAAQQMPQPQFVVQQTTYPQQEVVQTRRKNPGTKGRKTVVETNHMAVSIRPTKTPIIHYDVEIEPDKPKRLLRPAVEEFLRRECPGTFPGFDGRRNLFSYGYLPFGTFKSSQVSVNNEERQKVEEYTVTMKEANRINLGDLQNYITSGQSIDYPQKVIQAVDVVMRQAASRRFTLVGRSFFSPPSGQVVDLGNGLELWVGAFQSFNLGWKPYFNIDVAHKGFPKPQEVLNLMGELGGRNFDPHKGLDQYTWHDVESYLRGLKVEYEMPGVSNSKRVYRVNGLKEPAGKLYFNTADDGSGTKMSVLEYYRKSRNYDLKWPNLPCLHVGSKDRNIYIPAELCKVAPGQVIVKKMDEMQTSTLIKHAATAAYTRKSKIMEAFQKLGLNNDPSMKEFGITVTGEMERVEARVLAPPKLEYAREQHDIPSRGVWKAENKQFLQAGVVKKWAILNLERRTQSADIRNFEQMLQMVARKMGMSVAQCSGTYEADSRQQRQIDEKIGKMKEDGCNLLIVIVPDRGDTYSKVKQIAELKYGMLTQCLRSFTVSRKMNYSTANNILLKVNAKMDGVNHKLHIESRPVCLSSPIILMGADVTHPSPDSKDYPSIAAVTASHDPTGFKYNTEWRLQPPRMEIIEDLQEIVKNQLKFFNQKTQQKPGRIIFYRDGVSDGQFAEVLRKELSAIRRACASLNPNYKPAITFLVVQKRHHTRFFPLKREDEDGKNKNVPPGLVVDTKITHPRDMDFYLVSHQSIQGTSRPTKYCVLHDDANMSEDDVEQLTYYLCHLFSRCNRAVSYPAPTYYAHLAAFRAKAYIDGQQINIKDLDREKQKRIVQKNIMTDSPMFFV